MTCCLVTLHFLLGTLLLPLGGKIAEHHDYRYRTGALVCGLGSVVGFVGLCVWVSVRDVFGVSRKRRIR